MNSLKTISAAFAITLAACVGPAWAASDDASFNGLTTLYQAGQIRGEWANPLMPSGTGMYAEAQPSADVLVMAILDGYQRALLDRGGWKNQWVAEDSYASGEPLLAANIGDGVTTRTAAADLASLLRLALLSF